MDGPSAAQLALFAGTLTLAVLSPGPAVIACTRAAAVHGARSALPYAMGLALGASLWCLFALAGIVVLFQVVPVLYLVLRVGGGIYLVWFAWRLWRHAGDPLPAGRRVGGFAAGIALNLSNPKPALFYSSLIVAIFPGPHGVAGSAAIYAAAAATEVFWYGAVTGAMAQAPVRSLYLAAKSVIDRVAGTALGLLGLRLIVNPHG